MIDPKEFEAELLTITEKVHDEIGSDSLTYLVSKVFGEAVGHCNVYLKKTQQKEKEHLIEDLCNLRPSKDSAVMAEFVKRAKAIRENERKAKGNE